MTCHICAGNTCLGECEPPIAYIENLEREVAELKSHINVLREALEKILFQSESKQIDDIAQEALSATPSQSLIEHDNEVIERCAKVCESLKEQDYCVDVRQGAEAIRALIKKE